MKKVLTGISIFIVTSLNAGYFGILNNEVYIVINGVTTRATNQITLTGPGPHVLQDIYIQTEKQIFSGESNVCGGNLSWSVSGGNSGSGVSIIFFEELGINGLNQRQNWRASPNAVLSPTTNSFTFTITINLTGNSNGFTGCPETKTIVYNSNSILPVSFGKIAASQVDRSVKLQWEVFSEQNHDYYEAQRSDDGISWASFATVKTLEERSKVKIYEALDTKPLFGTNYYRIKQLDLDGTVSYSKITSIYFDESQNDLVVFPNPIVDNNVEVIFDAENASKIIIIDQLGRKILEKSIKATKSRTKVEVSFESQLAGLYVIGLQNIDGKMIAKKQVVKL